MSSKTTTRLMRGVLAVRRSARTAGRAMARLRLSPVALLLTLPLAVFLGGYAWWRYRMLDLYHGVITTYAAVAEVLATHDVPALVKVADIILLIFAAAMLLGIVAGHFRRPLALSAVRKCYILGYAICLVAAYVVLRVTGIIVDEELSLGGAVDDVLMFYFRWEMLWPLGALFILAGVFHLVSWRQRVIRCYYPATTEDVSPGDLFFEDVRRHGREPGYRKSIYGSFTAHLMVIVIIPWILRSCGLQDPYFIPEGGGDPVVQLVQMVKPPKKKKQQFVLNPNAAIYFSIPDLEDSDLEKEVEKESQVQYVTNALAVHGQTGKGGKGGPGWPDGMGKHPVRFIRLEYRGAAWDDGMAANQRAELNFLDWFRKRTGFKVADHAESKTITELGQFPKGFAPPFVYMTGDGGISIGSTDVRKLREYLFEGGMLFADAGSPEWDRAFRGLMASMFPDKPFVRISDDDPIYAFPFTFPNGAPPLWHHGGTKAHGVAHNGRWIVFYHPGDIGDAWETGHSGMRKDLAEASFDLGVNIVYYAFTNYLQETRKYRK